MTIRNLGDKLKSRPRIRAAQRGHSMEEEARDILQAALAAEPPQAGSLVGAIRARIEPLGGVDLEFVPREPLREMVKLEM